jgi:hypothetical protein
VIAQATGEKRSEGNGTLSPPVISGNGIANGDIESQDEAEGSTALTQTSGPPSAVEQLKRKTSELFGRLSRSSDSSILIPEMPTGLSSLVDGFNDSDQAKITEAEINRLHQGIGLGEMQDITTEVELLRGFRKASWWTQFRILSSRAFKNLYRCVPFRRLRLITKLIFTSAVQEPAFDGYPLCCGYRCRL